MAGKLNFRERWVLVTGASSGLGEEMANQLAAEYGANLILVARRADRLSDLAAKLESAHGVHCKVIAADLSRHGDVQRVFHEATAEHEIHGVILNAGITHFGKHQDLSWERFETLLQTNLVGVVWLVNNFLPYFAGKGIDGAIMLVSSMAGMMPVPYQAAYAGSKAFLTNFGQSLSEELRGEAVSITVFSPGGIATPMAHNSDLRYFENTMFLQDVASCAAQGLAAMAARRRLYVPGKFNRLQLFSSRFVPRAFSAALTGATYRKALRAAGH
ncbi:SDR family oxidoreductase [Alcanivorax sp. 1008]|uniref:SDR family NAD(P)-dependent oxidoreductase n=1 Tax=Alcanivorax sp. 1008 TaxID=2816853 RepID=UPI001D7D99CD|nr:SDR family NAD(P)-dependent oxidoreductase [Alcanivorax sp. 1008]MCC1497400.1 SDR family NAD(P)-dependent oxidoreductase [Alcanivorax sp. 1008]